MPTRYWNRILKGSLTPCRPLTTSSAPRTPPGPTSIRAGSPGLGRPQPPACAQASCLGAAPSGTSPTPRRVPRATSQQKEERASLPMCTCSALHLSLGPKIFRTTLYQPLSTQQTTHPRSNKTLTVQAKPHLSPTLGGPTKHAAPGQLKPPTTQAG